MSELSTRLDEIDLSAIEALVENHVPESQTIEFKRALPEGSGEAKLEFLKDVSAMANSMGGHIVYGVTEKDRVASGIQGVQVESEDRLQRQLQDISRTGLEPGLPALPMRFVALPDGNCVVVLRVAASGSRPHRVIRDRNNRFWGRTEAGCYELSGWELRTIIIGDSRAAGAAEDLRVDRLLKIGLGDTPIGPFDCPKAVIHLVPLEALTRPRHLDFTPYVRWHEMGKPLAAASRKHRGNPTYTVDGHAMLEGGASPSKYGLLFRNGVVEGVAAYQRHDGEKLLAGGWWEKVFIGGLQEYFRVMQFFELPGPFAVLLSLLDVSGYAMVAPYEVQWDRPAPIRRQHIIAAPLDVPDALGEADVVLRPAIDALWGAGELPYSPNYGKDGKWLGTTR